MRSLPFYSFPILVLLAACSGGGGGGSAEPGLNQGAFSAVSFGYQDPHAPDFHVLSSDVFAALRKDEVVVLTTDQAWVRDDGEAGFGTSTSLPLQVVADLQVVDAATGDVDGDYVKETIVAGRYFDPADGVHKLRVRVVEEDGAGNYLIAASFDVDEGPGHDFQVVRVDAGDLDGDERAEIVLSAAYLPLGGWIRVFEDHTEAAPGSLLATFDYPGADEVRGVVAQLDDDGPLELALYHGNGAAAAGVALDDAATGFATLADGFFEDYVGVLSADLVAGDFDGDRRDEIALVRTRPSGGTVHLELTLHDDVGGGLAPFSGPMWMGTATKWHAYQTALLRRVAAVDLDGDGTDGLAWLNVPYFGGGLELWHWSPGGSQSSLLLDAGVQGVSHEGGDLAVVDDDSDGVDELVVAYGEGPTTHTVALHDAGNGPEAYWSEARPYAPSFPANSPVIAGADFDADGAIVRWTGVKYQDLADPMPLVVLAAPPTLDGISQNYDASEVSYGIETATSRSFEVTTGTSMSTSFGYEQEDIFGLFTVSGKKTLSTEMEASVGEESEVSKTVSFEGSYDHDYVVFQGTLYTVYEYEVVAAADPLAVGSTLTLNVPVDSLVFKWTRDFYDQTFSGVDGELDWSQILGHTLGDPVSYPTQAEVRSVLNMFSGWEGESVTVGQGTASQSFGLALGSVITQGSSVTYSVDHEGEVTVGGVSAGKSYGLSNSYLYEVSLSNTTSYDGSVGDIEDPGQWSTWLYRTGIAAYTYDVVGQPKFQVVRFWVDPLGVGWN